MKVKHVLIVFVLCCMFSACLETKNDFDLGETVQISQGETLYENAGLWVKLDSIITHTPDTTTIYELKFTIHSSVADTFFTVIPDSVSHLYFTGLATNTIIFSLDSVVSLCTTEGGMSFAYFTLNMYSTIDRKPNIYIYPEKTTRMNVSLQFPKGGEIIESLPAYNKGWKDISVEPDGTIDNAYSYLFYEAAVDDYWQYKEGWVIAQKDLMAFFKCCMLDYGFSAHEIYDFIAYWIPRLTDYPYYEIYPQTRDIMDEIMPLTLSVKPNHILRVSFVVKGRHNKFKMMRRPEVDSLEREGFVVTEWGLVLKQKE